MENNDNDGFLSDELEDTQSEFNWDWDEEDDDDDFLEGVDLDSEPDEPDGDQTNGHTWEAKNAPEVYYHSSEDMHELEDESVHLVVTSPPYNADWAYGSHDDNMDYHTEYLPMLARVFEECYRVLVPGGRLCINLPTLLRGGSEGGQAILSDVDTLLNDKVSLWQVNTELEGFGGDNMGYKDIHSCMENTDFLHREWITWNKGFNTDGLAPNGSFPRPWGVLLNNMHEGISIYQKPGDRDYSDMSDEQIEQSEIDKASDDLCDDVWDIHPESFDFRFVEDEDVPVFPEELVRRCIKLWSYKGDTVLEPFTGRGTTLKVAKEMGRDSIGYEVREGLKQDIENYTGMNNASLF